MMDPIVALADYIDVLILFLLGVDRLPKDVRRPPTRWMYDLVKVTGNCWVRGARDRLL